MVFQIHDRCPSFLPISLTEIINGKVFPTEDFAQA